MRNGFTYVAGIFVLLTVLVLFATVTVNDILPLYIMVYIVTGVGICCSIMYLIGIPEARLTRQAKYYDEMYQKKKNELEIGGAGDPLLPNAIAETMQDDTVENSEAIEDL